MNAAFTSMIMQRMCQNTRRCRTSQQARIQSVAAVAAWGWTDGDEDLVSAWRQLSPCRHWLALPWRSELCKLTEIARALALSRHAPGAVPAGVVSVGEGLTSPIVSLASHSSAIYVPTGPLPCPGDSHAAPHRRATERRRILPVRSNRPVDIVTPRRLRDTEVGCSSIWPCH